MAEKKKEKEEKKQGKPRGLKSLLSQNKKQEQAKPAKKEAQPKIKRGARLKEPAFDANKKTLLWYEGEAQASWALASTIPPEEVPSYSQAAHKRDEAGYNRLQNALCFVVIGGTLLIIAIIFFFLSFQRVRNQIVGINVASLQFVIFVLTTACALIGLSIGFTLLVGALEQRKAAKRDIAYLGTLARK